MRLQAISLAPYSNFQEAYLLDVSLNPLGGLRWLPFFRDQVSVRARAVFLDLEYEYQTISDWRRDWRVEKPSLVRTRCVRLPLLRRPIGAGTVFELFAELFPLWVKSRFAGCKDRKVVWDLWLQFVPMKRGVCTLLLWLMGRYM